MVYKLKRLYLDVMFELYGVLHKWFIKTQTKASNYWASKADKCLDKRDDILEQLFA